MSSDKHQLTPPHTDTIDIIWCGHELTVSSKHRPHTITRCNKCGVAVCTGCMETTPECADNNTKLIELTALRYQLRDKIGEVDQLLTAIYELTANIQAGTKP